MSIQPEGTPPRHSRHQGHCLRPALERSPPRSRPAQKHLSLTSGFRKKGGIIKPIKILPQDCLGNRKAPEMSFFRFSDVIAEARTRPTDLPDQLVKGPVLLPLCSRFPCIAPFPTWSTYLIPFFPSQAHYNVMTHPKAKSTHRFPPASTHFSQPTAQLHAGHHQVCALGQESGPVPAWCVLPCEGLLLGPSPAALKAEMQTMYRVWLVRFLSRTVVSGRKRTFTFSVSFWTSLSQ